MLVLEPGTIFARDYRVLEPIAAGGMGGVYRVEQLSTLKHRALKVLHTRVFDDERARGRFIREATVGARIESAHVVEVIGAGIDELTGMPWLAMELLDGFDLGAVVRYHQSLEPPELLVVFRQMCHGLAAAHGASIVHRDLKPENVFVARSHRAGAPFTVKLLDFGIAKVVRDTSAATDTGVIGSPMWMAPEQINADVLSPRTDVWALGLLAFWALTGRVYWKAAHGTRVTAQALFVEQLFSPIEAASTRAHLYGSAEAIPSGFDEWFAACVQRDPAHRFEDAAAAFNALRSVLAELSATTERPLLPDVGHVPTAGADASAGARGHTTIEGTTDRMSRTGVPTIIGTQPSDGFSLDMGSAPLRVPEASSRVTAEVSAPVDAASTMVAPRPPRSGPAAKLVGLVGLCAALGGAGLTVAFMSGREAKRREVADARSGPPPGTRRGEGAAADGRSAFDDGLDALELEPKSPDSRAHTAGRKATQPSSAPASLEFLGWARDGSVFVLQTAHGDEVAKDGRPANYVELVEVYDGLTGVMVDSYLRKRVADPSIPKTDRLAKLAAEAEPLGEWGRRAAAIGLLAPDSHRARIRRPGEVRIGASEVPLESKIRIVPTRVGIDYVWWGVSPAGSGLQASPPGPRLRLDLVEPEARHALLDTHVGFSYDDIARLAADAGAPVTVDGKLRFHWSPTEDRLVIELKGTTSVPGDRECRWFLRAAGPQIRLIDGGAGQKVARQAAERLAAAGVPIAVVDLDYNPVARSEVHYRSADADGEALARRLEGALGGELPARALETDGWTAAVVVLGEDFDESRVR